MKRYLRTPEEIIKELKKGKEVLCDTFGRHYIYKMIDGVVYKYNENSWVMNGCLDSSDKAYIDEPEPIKLEVGKFYKTRTGKKAFVFAKIGREYPYPFYVAKVENPVTYSVDADGRKTDEENPSDLVAPWEE